MKSFYLILIIILLVIALPGEACGKSIKAYFNGQEATVTGIVLHPGEPFTIDLYMTPDRESYAYAEIEEPGGTRAYDLLEGDEIIPSAARRCNASTTAHYRWVMAANEAWLDGTAPLNIYYQLNPAGWNTPDASGLFTVVEAHIAPGEASVKVPNMSAAGAPENAYSPDLFAAAIGVILAAIIVRQKGK